ncbi:hypothetical protein EV182_002520 [Spiromyces aspiralis]|uniref:Uncharacterized protein n=1 Tax=Spiromyces aspiralis TaxID=68401 RepID=A0ACC1HKH9_9FUNG|nr:hypothetical protein EV182_002520 [Spiromyces aspiralis]
MSPNPEFSAVSASQSRESLASSIANSEVARQRLNPRSNDLEDADTFILREASRSQFARQQRYMTTLKSSQKIRSSLPPHSLPSKRRDSSSSSISRTHYNPMPNSAAGGTSRFHSLSKLPSATNIPSSVVASSSIIPLPVNHPSLSTHNGHFQKQRVSSGSNSSSSSSSSSGNNNNNNSNIAATQQQSPSLATPRSLPAYPREHSISTPQLSPPAFLRSLNDIFFAKFCVDELFSKTMREQLVRRIQESTVMFDSDSLRTIIEDISSPVKSTRLNLDAVGQWRLSAMDRTSPNHCPSVIDHIFLINLNVMCFDQNYTRMCLGRFCADPICTDAHSEFISEQDRAKAFRRLINIVLNEGLRIRLITAEQKMLIRSRLVKNFVSNDDRIMVVRELAVLCLLAQSDRYRDLALHSLLRIGDNWASLSAEFPSCTIDSSAGEDDINLDPDKVHRKAVAVANNPFLRSYLSVLNLDIGISRAEHDGLLRLWLDIAAPPSCSTTSTLTLPALLNLFISCTETQISAVLPGQSTRSSGPHHSRVEEIEDAALQLAQRLGFTWEMGDRPAPNLAQLCMALVMELGSVFDKFVTVDRSKGGAPEADSDAKEIGQLDDKPFMCWSRVCRSVIRFERAKKRFLPALLLTYLQVKSEALLSNSKHAVNVFQPDMFLAIALDLLTEYRKRRPDYEAITLSSDGQLRPVLGPDRCPIQLGRNAREEIGSEFDRIYCWVDKLFPHTLHIRSKLDVSQSK